MVPEDLRYTKTHEWVRSEGDQATVGITDHAQSELGDIVYIELPQAGAVAQADSVLGTIESVKTVSDLVTPVSGTVTEVNTELPDTPEKVNDSPYEDGWLVKIKMDNPAQINDLLTAEQYESFIQEH